MNLESQPCDPLCGDLPEICGICGSLPEGKAIGLGCRAEAGASEANDVNLEGQPCDPFCGDQREICGICGNLPEGNAIG
ncbi:MAG: hypothetical protein HY898_21340 [Deltaproteobacteria bacterium]|nr:hypothetical protein [Deltaproteobacteria bacterium]